VGPTAVGKTAAGIALAERIGGEIVSADSRCVYRRMDVGTAKPTAADRARVRHHLIDLVEPDEDYSVARFLADAQAAVADILARGRRPIVVGGTGYWLSALLGGATSAGVPPNEPLRVELSRAPLKALVERLEAIDPAAAVAIDRRNPRRLIRAIEVVEATGRPFAEARAGREVLAGARLIGLTLPRPALYARIDRRYDQMVEAGWLDEVRWLLARGYRRDLPSMSGLGYREMAAHLVGEVGLGEALARTKARCHRYARAQYGWFRLDDPRIAWVEAGPGADEQIERLVGERAA
jgi:tRNA dimethylallyltransferase